MLKEQPFEDPEKYLSRLKQCIHPETKAILVEYLRAKMASKRSEDTVITYINDFNAVFGYLNQKSIVDLTAKRFR